MCTTMLPVFLAALPGLNTKVRRREDVLVEFAVGAARQLFHSA